MKSAFTSRCLMLLLPVVILACQDQPSDDPMGRRLKEHGLEFWIFEPDGNARIIGLCQPTGEIIIPPDVSGLHVTSNYITGLKDASQRPSEWMSPLWEKSGFFLRIKASGEIRWFISREEMLAEVKRIDAVGSESGFSD